MENSTAHTVYKNGGHSYFFKTKPDTQKYIAGKSAVYHTIFH